MPLVKSCSVDAYKSNIAELIRSGRDPKQAAAIARDTLSDACKSEGKEIPRLDSVDDITSVQRYDLSRIGNCQKTPQGFLRFDANLTRVGVLEYRRADGTIQREYRPAEEVFKADSLATLAGAPLTDLHVEAVTPSNVRQVQRGRVSDDVRHDQKFVKSSVIAQDSDLIDKIDRGERKELSAGYRCRIDATPGVFDGAPYDAIQRDIAYNHVAIGPVGWGRAGSDVAIRLDAGSAVSFDYDVSMVIRDEKNPGGPAGNQKVNMKRNLRIDGIDYAVDGDDAVFQAFDRWVQKRDEGEKALSDKLKSTESKADSNDKAATALRDELQGKYDAATKEAESLKKQLTEASDPKRLDELANKRADLIGKAREVLGAEEKLDGLSPREIKELVLKKLDTEIKLDGCADAYVDGMFDHSVKTLKAARSDGAAGSRAASMPTPPAGGSNNNKPVDPRQARQDMVTASENAWKTKSANA